MRSGVKIETGQSMLSRLGTRCPHTGFLGFALGEALLVPPSRETAGLLHAVLAQPLAEIEWLISALRAHIKTTTGSGSKQVQSDGSKEVHAPVQNGSNEQEVLILRFSEFWKFYPRKTGKQEALRIYRRINPNQELHEKILRAVRAQKTWDQWTKDQGQFIPHPKTWLNQGRWDDEPVNAPVQRPVNQRFNGGLEPEWTKGLSQEQVQAELKRVSQGNRGG